MRFAGFVVTGTGSSVTVCTTDFDETELTPESEWKQAYSNEDPAYPSGFVDPVAALHDVCRRLLMSDGGQQPGAEPLDSEALPSSAIRTIEDLAEFVLRTTAKSSQHETAHQNLGAQQDPRWHSCG